MPTRFYHLHNNARRTQRTIGARRQHIAFAQTLNGQDSSLLPPSSPFRPHTTTYHLPLPLPLSLAAPEPEPICVHLRVAQPTQGLPDTAVRHHSPDPSFPLPPSPITLTLFVKALVGHAARNHPRPRSTHRLLLTPRLRTPAAPCLLREVCDFSCVDVPCSVERHILVGLGYCRDGKRGVFSIVALPHSLFARADDVYVYSPRLRSLRYPCHRD